MRKRIATSLDVSLIDYTKDTDLMQREWFYRKQRSEITKQNLFQKEKQVLFMNILEPIVDFSSYNFWCLCIQFVPQTF